MDEQNIIEQEVPKVVEESTNDEHKFDCLEVNIQNALNTSQDVYGDMNHATFESIQEDIEYEYVFGDMTDEEKDMKLSLLKEYQEAVAKEFNVANMLPQCGSSEGVGVINPVLKKSSEKINDVELPDGDVNELILPKNISVGEDVLEYVSNPEMDYNYYVEAGIKEMIDTAFDKVKISYKTKQTLIERATLKIKLKRAMKKGSDKILITDLKKQLTQKEKELRTLKQGLEPETIAQIDKVGKELEAALSKDDEVVKESVEDEFGDDLLLEYSNMDYYKSMKELEECRKSKNHEKTKKIVIASIIAATASLVIIKKIKKNIQNKKEKEQFDEMEKKVVEAIANAKKAFAEYKSTLSEEDYKNAHDKIEYAKKLNNAHRWVTDRDLELIRLLVTLDEIKDRHAETLKESVEDELYEEGLKETMAKVGDKATKSAKPINDTVNHGTDKVARLMVKKPKDGSESHVYDEYEAKIAKVKASLKLTAIGAGEVGIFFIPIPGSSAAFNAVVLAGLKTSEDSSDLIVKAKLREIKNKANRLKDNVANFFDKNKKKKFNTTEELKKQFAALDAEAAMLAKQIDSVKNNKLKMATESTQTNYPTIPNTITEEYYESVIEFISNIDESNLNDMIYAESMVDVLLKDSGLLVESNKNDIYTTFENQREEYELKLESAQNENNLDVIRIYENKLNHLNRSIEKQREFDSYFEKANMEDEIKPVVAKLNAKGYKVKYASPGHTKLRKKTDRDRDGVYYDKLYSDARIMFKGDYNFPSAPKYWHWRTVEDCDYLDITPKAYNSKDGSPEEAFSKWKASYMETLKTWVDNLPEKNTAKEDVVVTKKNGMKEVVESVSYEDLFDEIMGE